VTREQALQALQHFVSQALPRYGDYQDAMRSGEPWLFHSLLSTSLNIGLLLPAEVCEAAIAQWRAGTAPLNAVEGFVRQILGWREYVRGLYWAWMPGYAESNHLQAQRPLPAFFWTGNTSLRCLSQVIHETRRNAYAHHIQRLMITGNFALLAGLAPAEVEQWYLAVYADAFDWVELPNTHGMVLHADGGLLASKPYAASGAYISRMSDYCKGCAYNPKLKTGAKACPFNYLYWDFLLRNREKLAGNVRLAMPYRSLQNMDAAKLTQIREDSLLFLSSLDA
jgi:deoxyribodipyrimidine photolyase-related protein